MEVLILELDGLKIMRDPEREGFVLRDAEGREVANKRVLLIHGDAVRALAHEDSR